MLGVEWYVHLSRVTGDDGKRLCPALVICPDNSTGVKPLTPDSANTGFAVPGFTCHQYQLNRQIEIA